MNKLIEFNKGKLISELKSAFARLTEVYAELFRTRYAESLEFRSYVDANIGNQGDSEEVVHNNYACTFVHRTSFITISKLLLIRICEEMELADSRTNIENVVNMSLTEIIEVLSLKGSFSEIEKTYKGKRGAYELLNPYVDLQEKNTYKNFKNNSILKFHEIVKDIMEMLYKNRYDFKNAVEHKLLGDVYEGLMDTEIRKMLGQFYTPEFIVDYILNSTVAEIDIVDNPFVKVLDPACGSGHFLLSAYDLLKCKFEEKLEALQHKYAAEVYELKRNGSQKSINGCQYWRKENIHYHILKHCIFGSDVDEFAVQLTVVNLLLKDFPNLVEDLNIIQCDSLVKCEGKELQLSVFNEAGELEQSEESKNYADKVYKFWSGKFDIILGNPPYIGHKQLSMKYKRWLEDNYKEVFRDKADLSYCFFCRAMELLEPAGKIGFITSRYFMESPTGKGLRHYLKKQSEIHGIIDFYGANIFKGVGVASAIFILGKSESFDEMRDILIKVSKLKYDNFEFKDVKNLTELIACNAFESFNVSQKHLDDERWILIPEWKNEIYRRIQEQCPHKLEDMVISFQGIITGCDKAFIVKEEQIESCSIERELLKPWIKNSNVNKYVAEKPVYNIIYSDLIKDEAKYPFSINFINNHREKLVDRRECRKGIRKWYELQWGRDIDLFCSDKVIYPYKAKGNRFAVDKDNCLCSADVYSFSIKNEYSQYSVEYLCGVLNSKIYEFYFKLFAKKMGSGMYDYYPNSVLCLRIPDFNKCREIENYSKKIISILEENKTCAVQEGSMDTSKAVEEYENKINTTLAEYFNLSDEQLKLINEY